MSVDNGDVNGSYFYIIYLTGYESKNHNPVDCKKKRYEISINRNIMENNEWPDGVGIDDMLPSSSLLHFANMEYNN